MPPMNKLRKQHEDILFIVDRISADLETVTDHITATDLLNSIRQLCALFEKHSLLEDEFLYPVLKRHPQENIRDTAYLFSIELGGIKNAISKSSEKWSSSNNISQSHLSFVSENKALLDALRRRIAKEENELFPLVEA